MWWSVVFGEMYRRSAISLVVSPLAARARTSTSRPESPPGCCARREFEHREVALRVAVVPELFFHDGLEAIEHRGLAVLEHLDFSREVRSVDVGQVSAKLRGTVGAHGERFSERRLDAVVESGPREVERACVRESHRMEALAEDRHVEPLFHGEDEVPHRLHERELFVDRFLRLLFAERLRTRNRRSPHLFERRPCGAQAVWI